MRATRDDWRTMAADIRESSHALVTRGGLDTRDKWITVTLMMLAEGIRLGEARSVLDGMRLGLNQSLQTGGWRPVKKHEWRALVREASSPAWQAYMARASAGGEGS